MNQKDFSTSDDIDKKLLPQLLSFFSESEKETVLSAYNDLYNNISINQSTFLQEYNYDQAVNVAEKYLRQNFIRDSLYYFEEAVFFARKEKSVKKEIYCLNKIGSILNNTGNYWDSKAFYDFIFKNKPIRLWFTCQSNGPCCKLFKVNTTTYDVKRILENRPDLKLEDFVTFQNTFIGRYLSKTSHSLANTTFEEETIFFLKKKNEVECIFLENNLCSINEFKPDACKRWPFILDNNNRISFILHPKVREIIENSCKYKIYSDSMDETELRKYLKKSNYYMAFDYSIMQELQKSFISGKNYDLKEIIDFIQSESIKRNKFINTIYDSLMTNDEVIKIKSHFRFDSNGTDLILYLFAYTDSDIPDQVINKLTGLKPGKKQYYEKDGNKFVKFIFDENFGCIVSVLPYLDHEIIYYNENILYEKEGLYFPQKENFISIPVDGSIFDEILRAVKKIIKYSYKEKKFELIEDVLVNLNTLCERLNNEKIYIGSLKYNELFEKINRTIFDLTVTPVESIALLNSDDIKPSLYKFSTELDKEINKNDEYLYNYMLIKLEILNKLKNYWEEEKLLEKIIELIPDNDYENEHKLMKIISRLRRDYKAANKKIICLILLELFDFESEKQNIKRICFYLDLFFEFYSPNLFKGDSVCSPSYIEELLFEGGKYHIKLKNIQKAERYFELLIKGFRFTEYNTYESYTDKLEILSKIADEFLEENYTEKAIFYYELALKNTVEIDEKMILMELLVDLYINLKNFDQVKKIISTLIDISEKNLMEEVRIFAYVKNARIKYLNPGKDSSPLEMVRNYKSDELIFPLLLSYFAKAIKEKFTTVPLKIKNLKLGINKIESYPAKSYVIEEKTKLFHEIFNLIKYLIISRREIFLLDEIIKDNKTCNLYLNLKLCEEFDDLKKAVYYAEKIIYYCMNNFFPNPVINFFKIYLAYIYEKMGNYDISFSKFEIINNEHPDEESTTLFKITNFQYLLVLNEKKMNRLISSDMFVFLSDVIDNLKL